MQDNFPQNQSAYPTKVQELGFLFRRSIPSMVRVFMFKLGRDARISNRRQPRRNRLCSQWRLCVVSITLFCLGLGTFVRAQDRQPATPDSLFGAQEWVRPSETSLGSQSLIRPSLATTQSASERAHLFGLSQPATSLDYNLKLGPIAFKFGAGLGTEFNDNITLSDKERVADFIVSPQFSITGSWPITIYNTLTIQLGLGYSAYLNHSEFNSPSSSFRIDPGITKLSFDIKVGDFYFNLHDKPSLEQDAANELTLRNPTASLTYSRFSNIIGLSVLRDLNKVVLSAGYDHIDVIPFQSEFKYLQQSTEQFNTSMQVKVSEAISTGLEGSFSIVKYKEHLQNDSTDYHFGPFLETQLSNFVKISLSGGYQGGIFNSNGTNGDSSNLNSYYANLSITNNLNAYISQVISVGHESQLGTSTNFTEGNYIRHEATLKIFSRFDLGTSAFFEDAHESGGALAQDFRRYGFGFGFNYQLSKHLGASVQYNFIKRDANSGTDLNGGSLAYYQNRIDLDFSYAF